MSLPNRIYDPELGYDLYHKYFDIYAEADRLGLDIMVNEHHSTPTCVDPAVSILWLSSPEKPGMLASCHWEAPWPIDTNLFEWPKRWP